MSLADLKINAIDCYGLNKEDQKRIEEIGLWCWMDEVANQKVAPKRICDSTTTLPHDALEYRRRQKANITKRPRICAVCDKTFYARRSDALYCSQRCRQKGNYRKSLKQGSTPHIPTDNAFCDRESMTYKPHLTRYVGQVIRSFPTRTCVITEGWGHVNSRYASFESLHEL